MIALREFETPDAAVVASWVQGPEELTTWSGNSGFTWPFTAEQLTAAHAAVPRRRVLVADGPDGTPISHLALTPDARGWSARIGMILVSPAARGRGIGAAVIEAAMRIAFEELQVHRLDLGVYPHNTRAIGLYERLGFRREGVHREVTLVDGEWWSSVNMSILSHEWPGSGARS
ncbi:GNAT family N-acetyltransferase [Sphaerisporangium fuscum]|uniref:GNAT family N-acetyltransferase n=1 Tax=Sphaerisporangium fuscum TaxID=2835868 RepID=UPI001BDCD902|nr:GNAT family protein [Sphaerisporangium fuscum]